MTAHPDSVRTDAAEATPLPTASVGLTTRTSIEPDEHGHFGVYGGRHVPEALMAVIDEVTTIEGLGNPEKLHPMQAAFVKHDGFQCGYCTPGQIVSATAMLEELRQGWPSQMTGDLGRPELTDDEIRERMSGNICRCSCYPNIVDAIRDAAQGGDRANAEDAA